VVLKRTPVLARFHPRVYFSKSSDSGSNHEEIDIDEKNSHRQRSSDSDNQQNQNENLPPPRREEYAYKATMSNKYNQNDEL